MRKFLFGVLAVLPLWFASCATNEEEPLGATSTDEADLLRTEEATASDEATVGDPQGCGMPQGYCSRVYGTACFPEGSTRLCVMPGTCEFPTCYCTDGLWECEFSG